MPYDLQSSCEGVGGKIHCTLHQVRTYFNFLQGCPPDGLRIDCGLIGELHHLASMFLWEGKRIAIQGRVTSSVLQGICENTLTQKTCFRTLVHQFRRVAGKICEDHVP